MANTNLDALKSVNAYPIPLRTLVEVSERRDITLMEEVSKEVEAGRNMRLAKADLLIWLSLAPNISQGGQSYSFSEDQRKRLRLDAKAIYDELEPTNNAGCVTFGYKGDRL